MILWRPEMQPALNLKEQEEELRKQHEALLVDKSAVEAEIEALKKKHAQAVDKARAEDGAGRLTQEWLFPKRRHLDVMMGQFHAANNRLDRTLKQLKENEDEREKLAREQDKAIRTFIVERRASLEAELFERNKDESFQDTLSEAVALDMLQGRLNRGDINEGCESYRDPLWGRVFVAENVRGIPPSVRPASLHSGQIETDAMVVLENILEAIMPRR